MNVGPYGSPTAAIAAGRGNHTPGQDIAEIIFVAPAAEVKLVAWSGGTGPVQGFRVESHQSPSA